MSLLAFQKALSDLAASPELCRAVRADADAVLAAYDLTPLERRRVASVAAQPGMAVNCTLHRSNRIQSILALLPLSVHLIGEGMRRVADLFWEAYPTPDFTTRRELHRFGAWVRAALADGTLDVPFLGEVLDYELGLYALGMLPRKRTLARVAETAARFPEGPVALHPLVRVAAFRHDPAVLLPLVIGKAPPPYDVPAGEFYLILDVREEARRVAPLDPAWGRLLHAFATGAAPLGPAQEAALLSAGILVRTAPSSAHAAEAALAGAA